MLSPRSDRFVDTTPGGCGRFVYNARRRRAAPRRSASSSSEGIGDDCTMPQPQPPLELPPPLVMPPVVPLVVPPLVPPPGGGEPGATLVVSAAMQPEAASPTVNISGRPANP